MRPEERTDIATVDELHASATKLTGLDDFGVDNDNYREALGVLLDSYRREAGLTVLGSKMNRFFLRGALVARLLSESAFKQYPQHADVDDQAPHLCHRTGTHRHDGVAPAARRRSGASGTAHVAGGISAATPAARHLGLAPAVPPTRRPVQPAPPGQSGLHRPALHGRVRTRGMLAVAAPVAAFGVLRDAGAPADVTQSGCRSRTGRRPTGVTARTCS